MQTDRTGIDLSHLSWRKSSHSTNQGNCVEVADNITGHVPVRDSKDPNGPALVIPADSWQAFIANLRTR
ncbi:DUF397 domain-containing protein [Kitasatospora acidiphila]|uniref:DUF397 domain-containing protein n=1 Tax=Kitasatospora acidiphila TaxID=2567942 RepID=A0A540WA61_9ACTN|nr:DUF397 domain-containing protein [Kitasatospora acidiphila]TQF05905.1 DUF397 domain-containing protein [Kitasatospora acidiphila]